METTRKLDHFALVEEADVKRKLRSCRTIKYRRRKLDPRLVLLLTSLLPRITLTIDVVSEMRPSDAHYESC